MTGIADTQYLEGRGRTVFVLDDDEAVRQSIRRTLLLHDYEVVEAETAAKAFEMLASYIGTIDVIMCDLVLPGLGGREAANILMAKRPEAKILYMSGYSTHDSFRRALEEEGVPFLGKPFEMGELLDAVRGLLAE